MSRENVFINRTKNIAIIFAGGIGQRLNNNDHLPKQFIMVNSNPIIIHTLDLFEKNKKIDKIYISIHPDYYEFMSELTEYYRINKTAGIVKGGSTGQESIYKALKLAEKENPPESLVLIHDGVRPAITQKVIDDNIETAMKTGTAITCTPCHETILISKDGLHPQNVPYRRETYSAQAPQTFRLGDIINAHETERKTNPDYIDIVDSCTLFSKQGRKTTLVSGNLGNIKITTIEDLYILRALIRFNEDVAVFNSQKEQILCKN